MTRLSYPRARRILTVSLLTALSLAAESSQVKDLKASVTAQSWELRQLHDTVAAQGATILQLRDQLNRERAVTSADIRQGVSYASATARNESDTLAALLSVRQELSLLDERRVEGQRERRAAEDDARLSGRLLVGMACLMAFATAVSVAIYFRKRV